MSIEQTMKPRHPEARGALDALRRAADLARKTAIQTDTAIIIVRDGKRVRISADELRQQQAARAR